jgi:hypothetical protein
MGIHPAKKAKRSAQSLRRRFAKIAAKSDRLFPALDLSQTAVDPAQG